MYDFRCAQCQHVFEAVVASDATAPLCPECSSASERLLSPPNFKVKKRSEKAAYYSKKALAEWKEQQGGKKTFPMAGKPQKKTST
jgi:putative FmdB family regulatory protein